MKAAFTKMVFYLLARRQKRQADQLRATTLAFKAFRSLMMHTGGTKQRGSLARKQRQFLQYRERRSIEGVFMRWYAAFKEESVVRRFRLYRERKIMSAFVGQLVTALNIQRKLDKIGKHASLYFGKRRQTQLVQGCFNSLKTYSYER